MEPTPTIGTEIAGYRIERKIGRGGMGVVYLAEHMRLGRKAAVKILSPELEDERFRERFTRESQLAASLDHPNIVPVYDAGEADGVLYIAMRYVEGVDLGALIKAEGALEPARAIEIVEHVGNALDAAHAEGLVHRDVKPGNILIVPRSGPAGHDRVFLTDFGLTKHAHSTTGLTRTGQFIGTIDYVAPEQIEGKEIDGRADEYSLGCVLYQCLTGKVPYEQDNEVAVMYAHLRQPPPLIRAERPDLPEALEAVVAKAMAKDRDERFATCDEMTAAAHAALDGTSAVATDAAAQATSPGDTGPGTVISERPDAVSETASAAVVASPLVEAATPVVEPALEKGRSPGARAVIFGAAAFVVVLIGVVVVVLTTGGSTPTPSVVPTPSQGPGKHSTAPAQSTDAELTSYMSTVDGTLAQSAQARTTINDALMDANSANHTKQEQAPVELRTAIGQRTQQVAILRGLDPPTDAQRATRLLVSALLASIQSDQLYLRSVEAKLAGNATGEQTLLIQAQQNDQQKVDPLKHQFIHAYNLLRNRVGLATLPNQPTF